MSENKRSIPGGIFDAKLGAYASLPKGVWQHAAPETAAVLPPAPQVIEDKPAAMAAADVSIDTLLQSQLLILYRETRELLKASSTGSLDKDGQQALVNVVRLTMEFKKHEKELLDEMSDEELKALADKKSKG